MNFNNIDADAMFQKLLKRIEEFETAHEKGEIPGRKDLIDYLILRLRIESPEEDIIHTEYTSDSIIVTITSDEILYIDTVPTLKHLIQTANTFKITSENGKVILTMTCHLWEWKKKNQD